ncbi:MAG TPA: PAS domain S-box protein, partial [Armatimonadota bacterium]
ENVRLRTLHLHDETEHARAQQYLDIAGVMLLALDRDGRVTLLNRKGLEILGYAPEEILGKNWFDLVVPAAERAAVRTVFDRLMNGQATLPNYYENCLVTKGGCERLLAFHNVVLRDELGQIIGSLSSGEDITEQRAAEEELRESETRFRQLADAMPQLVWTADPDGRVDYYNNRYREYKGITLAVDGLSYQWTPVLHPDDLQPTVAAWEHALATGEVYQVEHRVRMADGSYRWHLSRGVPAHDAEGRMIKWYGTATDIHEFRVVLEERERLLQEVQARAAELDAIIASIADGLVVNDPEGRILLANPAAERLLVVPPREQWNIPFRVRWQGRRILQPNGTEISVGDFPALRALRGEVVRNQVLNVQIPGHPDIWLSISAAPILTPEGQVRGAVTIFADLTVLHNLQQEVQRRVAELDATFTSIADGLIIYSPEGEILLDNPAARRLLDGILVEEEYNADLPQWVGQHARTPEGKPLSTEDTPGARAARGETVTGEVRVFRHKDGSEAWVSLTAAPIRTHNDTIIGVVGTYTDITVLHDLQEQQRALLQTVSHDLRAPLSVINGYAQLLYQQIDEEGIDGLLRKGVAAIQRGV